MNWLHYLLEANIYLVIFYLLYLIFLDRETHYKLNRMYLLLACAAAYMLPFMQAGALKPVVEHTSGGITAVTYTGFQAQAPVAPVFTFQDAIFYAYILGAAIMLVILLFKLAAVIKLAKAPKGLVEDKYKLINIKDSNTAFSFFNYLFIGSKVSGADTIIRHELVHIRQKHSFDIVFLEILKVISWFNPFIYLLQLSLKTVHEYIADEQTAASENDAFAYSSFLVSNAYGAGGSSITHSFFNYNLLKKRIIMLHQKRSGNLARLKYLMALPVCAAMLCASTLGFSKTYGWIDLAPGKPAKAATISKAHKVTIDGKPDTAKSPVKLTPKGYKYEETGYLIKNKTNFRVIIIEKDGRQKEYFRNSATHAQLTLLKQKYGYTFPAMVIYPKLPPPPPMAVPQPVTDKRQPPPPPAPPKLSLKNHISPAPPIVVRDIRLKPAQPKKPVSLKLVPVTPESTDNAAPVPPVVKTDTLGRPVSRVKAVQLPHAFTGSDVKELDNVTITATDIAYKNKRGSKQDGPLVIVNNKIISTPLPSRGNTVSIHADKIIFYAAQNNNHKGGCQKMGRKS